MEQMNCNVGCIQYKYREYSVSTIEKKYSNIVAEDRVELGQSFHFPVTAAAGINVKE